MLMVPIAPAPAHHVAGVRRLVAAVLTTLLALAAAALTSESHAMKIQKITTPGGVTAWLVEEHSVPLVALRFAFEGGSAADPAGKEGIAHFLSAMLDEGAGDMKAAEFQERLEELAVRMSYDDARDRFYGSFETLTANREPAIELLRLAINRPRFDADAVQRIKAQLQASLAFAARDPNRVAGKAWSELAFPGHPYGRPREGTRETLTSVEGADLEAYRKRVFAKSTLSVVLVGDIDAAGAAAMLDKVFGELPAKASVAPVPAVALAQPTTKIVELDVPQSVLMFGLPGIGRDDPDFYAAVVLNQILGGGGFASRLMEEVREKRGLAYSTYSYMMNYRAAEVLAGGVATRNEDVARSLEVIESVLTDLATKGPSQNELDNSKSYLTGSFALRFDTNAKIANQLLGFMVDDYGIDYVERRNDLIRTVRLDDVKRVAARLLDTKKMVIAVVGKPQGLENRVR